MLPPGGDIVRGRSAIRNHYADAFEEDLERGNKRTIRFELVDRIVSGDVRNDYGYYFITLRTPSGHEGEHRGKFAKVWRRGSDGVWRIWSDSYSSAQRQP
jgi:ketosteroid isomerase-like protein